MIHRGLTNNLEINSNDCKNSDFVKFCPTRESGFSNDFRAIVDFEDPERYRRFQQCLEHSMNNLNERRETRAGSDLLREDTHSFRR